MQESKLTNINVNTYVNMQVSQKPMMFTYSTQNFISVSFDSTKARDEDICSNIPHS